ncbi:cupin domain-containing protein [Jatrophihabitans fulvus]
MSTTDTGGDPGGAVGTALARCVARTAGAFAAEHWGRAPLLSRAAELPSRFDDLLTAAAVDELTSERGLRTPFLRMAKDGEVLPAKRFTRGGGAGATIADQAADDKILTTMADGGTLVLQALHRSWPPLVDFSSRLAQELGHPVQVNAYITPPQNQGFAAHYDVHDVFVLQVSGRKRWSIHAPVVDAPLDDQPWDARADEVRAAAAGEPLIDTVLEPGDALYLPRGTIHSAAALGETSIHLTVGVHPLTRYHLVQHLLKAVADDVELRRSLPMGVDLGDPAALAAEFAETLEALQASLAHRSADAAARHLDLDLMRRTRPEAIGPLAQLTAAERLTGETALRLRRGLRLRLEHVGDELRVVLLDRTVVLPARMADAVKTAVSGGRVTPSQLPGLDADTQLTVARRLVREGVLVPAATLAG